MESGKPKLRIFAFYDVLVYSLTALFVGVPSAIAAVYSYIVGELWNRHWRRENLELIGIFAVGLAVSTLVFFGVYLIRHFCLYNEESADFYYITQPANDNIDVRWNRDVFISEVKDVELVTLSTNKLKTKVYYKHRANKYLKINLMYGKEKYVYVGCYSKRQIERIAAILTKSENNVNVNQCLHL